MSGRVQQDLPGVRLVAHALGGDLRLWLVDLDTCGDAEAFAELPRALRDRAERMALARDGRRLLASRHALRSLLAPDVGCSPAEIPLKHDPLGKLRLPVDRARFNLSRSGPYGLIGIGLDLEVGVDVEALRPVPELEALANDHLTNQEREGWSTAGPEERDRRFLVCWTRKEACAKALGAGFRIAPRAIDAGCAPEARIVRTGRGAMSRQVRVCSVDLGVGAVAAAAVTRPDQSVGPTSNSSSVPR